MLHYINSILKSTTAAIYVLKSKQLHIYSKLVPTPSSSGHILLISGSEKNNIVITVSEAQSIVCIVCIIVQVL